jgi:hypothetical protein
MGKTAHTLDVRARLSGDAARGMKSLGDSGVKAGKGMTAAFLKAQIALGAIRAAARGIVGLMRGITTESIDRLDKISKTSRQIGVSAEFLSSVGYAAEQSGIKSEVLVRGIRNVSRNMRQVAGGSKELIKVYDELGFTTEELADLARRGPEAAFRAIAKAVGEVDDETQRVSLAMRALGREAGPQLLKMVEGGLGAMDKYVADAHRLGLVVTQQQGEMAEAASEAIGEFEAAMTGVKNAIAVQIMPVLTPLLKKLATWIAENRKAVAAFFVEFVAGVVHVTIKLGRLYDVASTVFGGKGLGAKWPKAVRDLNQMVRDLRESVDGIPASPDSPLAGVRDDLDEIGREIVVLEPRIQSFWNKMAEGRKTYAKTETGEWVREDGHLKLESQIGGMKAGVEALAATATPENLGVSVIDAAADSWSSFLGAISDGSKDATAAVADMARSIAQDLSRLAQRFLVAQMFSGLLSLFGGGGGAAAAATGSGAPAFGGDIAGMFGSYQKGSRHQPFGVFSKPTLGIFGEIPERLTPVSQTFGMRSGREGAGGGNVSVNVTVNAGATSDAPGLGKRVAHEVLTALRRSGGYRRAVGREIGGTL